TGSTDRTYFTNGKAGEVVVQHERIAALYQGCIHGLLVHFGTEGHHVDGLGFTAGENGATVRSGQHIHFAPDGADLIHFAAIQADTLLQHGPAYTRFLCLLEVTREHGLIHLLLVGQRSHHLFLHLGKGLAPHFLGAGMQGDVVVFLERAIIDGLLQFGVVLFVVVSALDLALRHLRGQFIDHAALVLDGFVAQLDALDHLSFAHFLHLALHHHHVAGVAGHDQVDVCTFHFLEGRV